MPTEHRPMDVDAQLRAFAVALEAHTAEPIRPGPRPVAADDRDPVLVEPTPMPARPDRRRWLVPAVAAAVVVLALVAGLAVSSDDTTPSDTPAPNTPPPPTTAQEDDTEQPSPADVAVVEAFFAAYNTGDTDAVLSLLAVDVVVTEQYGGAAPNPNDDPLPNPDQQLAWKHAQGEIVTEPACIVAPNQPVEGSLVLCEYSTLDAFVQAVDGTPIPTHALFTIVDDEITELHQGYGNPDYSVLASQFRRWIEQNHADLFEALFGDWTTRDEAVEQGQLRTEWAQTWARSLAEADETETAAPSTPREVRLPSLAEIDTLPRYSDDSAPTSAGVATVPSSIGDLDLVLLDGRLPGWSHVELPMGYAALTEDGLILSADLVDWRTVPNPFPGPIRRLVEGDDPYRIEVERAGLHPDAWWRPTDTWESDDFVTWVRAEGSGPLAAAVEGPVSPAGFTDSHPELRGGSIAEGITLHWDFVKFDPYDVIIQAGGDELRRALDTGLHLGLPRWLPSGDGNGLLRIGLFEAGVDHERILYQGSPDWDAYEGRASSFVELDIAAAGTPDDWQLDIREARTGVLVDVVRGRVGLADLATTVDALLGRQLTGLPAFVVVTPDDVAHATPEWFPDLAWFPGLDAVGEVPEVARFESTANGLLAYVPGPSATAIWRTSDGLSWDPVSDDAGWPEADRSWPPTQRHLRLDDGTFLASNVDPGAEPLFMTSSDGISWSPAAEPPAIGNDGPNSYAGEVRATTRGFILAVEITLPDDSNEGGPFVWTSPDGDVWEQVEGLEDVRLRPADDELVLGPGWLESVTPPRAESTWLIDIATQ